MRIQPFLLPAFLLCLALLKSVSLCHADPGKPAEPVGRVISVTPGAEVFRDCRNLPLQPKDPIFAKDTIRTDTNGSVHVIFNDDTTINIGANASFTIREYTENGDASRFRGDLAAGVLRIITGRLVKRNPLGFHIFTPEATVGIRGTTLTIRRDIPRTTVLVEQTKKQVYVNETLVPSGNKMEVAPGVATVPRPMTVADREQITRDNPTLFAAPGETFQGEPYSATSLSPARARNFPCSCSCLSSSSRNEMPSPAS